MKIRDAAVESGQRPIVFNTLVDPDAVAGLREADALFLDLFEKFIDPSRTSSGSAPPTPPGASTALPKARTTSAASRRSTSPWPTTTASPTPTWPRPT
jgi:regulator of PEP synthase PpsR (kinase-PPPase family)